jgi:pimeloyl-ACP methyl ester carboxylesterase
MPEPDSGTETVGLRDGRSLGVEEYGAPGGMPVFYFHGTPESRLDLALLGGEFAAAGIRLIASDQPGFGLSSPQRKRTLLAWPDDVAQLADALEIDRFAVLGYSCGGKYAAACARALPERVLAAGIVSGIGPPQTPRFREGLNSVDRMSMTLATRARPLAMLYWRIAARMVNQSRDKFLAQLEKEVTDADKAALREPALRAT